MIGAHHNRRVRHLLLAALTVSSLWVGSAAAAPTAGTPPSLTLASQTPWVGAGDEFDLCLHVGGVPDPSALEVAAAVYRSVPSRSAFAQTLSDHVSGTPLKFASAPLSTLGAAACAGGPLVRLPVQDPSLPRDASRLFLAHEGVYPVQIELRAQGGGGESAARLTTHLIYAPAVHKGPKLDLAWVLPLHAPPGLQPDGTRKPPPVADLLAAARELDPAASTIPVVLAPTPETLQALQARAPTDAGATAALAALQRAAAGRQVVAQPYVPIDLPVLATGGLDDQIEAELDRGRALVPTLLKVRPDEFTWVGDEPLNEDALERLRGVGVDHLVVPDANLAPIRLRFTLTQPFLLAGRLGHSEPAVAADAGLGAHFVNGSDPVLRAHQLLADLAVIYFDQPDARQARGVVLLTPRGWRPSAAFLSTALSGLARSPLVQTTSLDTFFSAVPMARGTRGAPLVRQLPTFRPATSEALTALRVARRRLDAFHSIIDPDNTLYDQLDDRLLAGASADITSTRTRAAYAERVRRVVDQQVGAVKLPRGRSITLTARSGEIPITFRNDNPYPVHVLVRMRSEKLDFPKGSEQRLDLTRQNTTLRVAVKARTSGSIPLRITLESEDGSLPIDNTRLIIRSTATSGVGLALSIGAALFLLVWWVRHLVGGRRARRLVPA